MHHWSKRVVQLEACECELREAWKLTSVIPEVGTVITEGTLTVSHANRPATFRGTVEGIRTEGGLIAKSLEFVGLYPTVEVLLPEPFLLPDFLPIVEVVVLDGGKFANSCS